MSGLLCSASLPFGAVNSEDERRGYDFIVDVGFFLYGYVEDRGGCGQMSCLSLRSSSTQPG